MPNVNKGGLRTYHLLILALLGLSSFSHAEPLPPSPSSSPLANTELICPNDNPSECYPKEFQPTEEFQLVREGQDIPPGLHVRMNIWTGEKEARLNIPLEGEDGALDAHLEQGTIVVPGDYEETTNEELRKTNAVQKKEPPEYNPAGKIKQPHPEDTEFETFHKAMSLVEAEAPGFDAALDDLADLAHDIYYGVEIIKNSPLLEKLACLLAGHSSGYEVEGGKGHDHKAASILSNSVQNNPTALKELGKSQNLVLYPTCGAVGSSGDENEESLIELLRSQLTDERSPAGLKAKISALNGLIKDPFIRDDFIANGGMDLLLSMFLKGTDDQWSGVRDKVTNLVMDNFLDEEMGAELGIWPTLPVSAHEVCENSDEQTTDGCWEYHVEKSIAASESDATKERGSKFLKALKRQRTAVAPSKEGHMEL